MWGVQKRPESPRFFTWFLVSRVLRENGRHILTWEAFAGTKNRATVESRFGRPRLDPHNSGERLDAPVKPARSCG